MAYVIALYIALVQICVIMVLDGCLRILKLTCLKLKTMCVILKKTVLLSSLGFNDVTIHLHDLRRKVICYSCKIYEAASQCSVYALESKVSYAVFDNSYRTCSIFVYNNDTIEPSDDDSMLIDSTYMDEWYKEVFICPNCDIQFMMDPNVLRCCPHCGVKLYFANENNKWGNNKV